ncbi:MAG: DUF4276 family protein [Planctomycetes bacterium]|nr:DUF4276 family protein [Planctomycetota bacterium]
MHYEILIEDMSGKRALEILLPKIVAADDTYKIFCYKGIGRLPKKTKYHANPQKRALLDNLPRILQGYGNTPWAHAAKIIVVCDLDTDNEGAFRQKLHAVLKACNPQPNVRFCLAIEEGEAWILGDINAIIRAYPRARKSVLSAYKNDSICGTWECLANAVYPGGAAQLAQAGWQAVGREKSRWAEKICPYMEVRKNRSPSFQIFVSELGPA